MNAPPTSGANSEPRQLLARQWLAPLIPGWTFHAALQPGPLHVIRFGDGLFDPRQLWLTPTPDAPAEKFDLTLWHPAWHHVELTHRAKLARQMLHQALGEYGVSW